MNITVDPPMSLWRLGQSGGADRGAVVATGHQAWLWHPGILAKYVATTRAAVLLGAAPLHVVVDQDTHEALRLELPVRRGNRLIVEPLQLAPSEVNVPTGCQPPADAEVVIRNLRQARERFGESLLADTNRIAAAFESLPKCETLAQQMAVVLARLMDPLVGDLPVTFVTHLSRQDFFHGLVDRMLRDARACVNAYNHAAAQHPQARIAPLVTEPDRVELPLWLLEWRRPRQRVFADLADTKRPILTLESGRAIVPLKESLAPKALLLSVVLRGWVCDLFIHGKGGGVYDRVTEEWWPAWAGAELAPMAVVSADVSLALDVPVAERRDLERAVWRAHNLSSNIDRAANLAGPVVARKRELLAHMHDDRDRSRRAAAFLEIHRINDELARAHPALMTEANQLLERARDGIANRAAAAKRDWCFALYPAESLAQLKDAIG